MTYDAEADALYLWLREVEWGGQTVEIEETGVVADLDAQGHVIGLEVLDARERIGDAVLADSVPIKQLVAVLAEHR
jgi:uncharacterized protein YuzE